jgi:hypothetical protein
MNHNTRGAITSTHHQALHMCALWHKVTKVLAQVIVMMLPSYEQLVQQNLNYAKSCTSQQKKLKRVKRKVR